MESHLKKMFQTTNQIKKNTYKTNLRIIIPTIGENKIHVPNHQPEEPTNQPASIPFCFIPSQGIQGIQGSVSHRGQKSTSNVAISSWMWRNWSNLSEFSRFGKTGNQTCHQEPTRTNRTGTFLSIFNGTFFSFRKAQQNGSFSAGCQLFSETEWLFQ